MKTISSSCEGRREKGPLAQRNRATVSKPQVPGLSPGRATKKEFFDLLNKILTPIRGYT